MAVHLSTSESRALARVAAVCAESTQAMELREGIGKAMMDYLQGDTYASMVWDARASRFHQTVAVDMEPARLQQWHHYYRLVDPLTIQFMQRRKPTVATQIVARRDLTRTEFFADFLRPQRMHWGINVFLFHDGESLGDIRVWRSFPRGDFEDQELEKLRLVEPILHAALLRIRRNSQGDSRTLASLATARREEVAKDLSPRQREVLGLLRLGATDKEIARALKISHATVRFHIGCLMRRLEVSNRTAAASKCS